MAAAWAIKQFEPILADAVTRGDVQGVAFAMSDGARHESVAAGMANAKEGIPATADTIFHIGSVTKVFTAELIWRLIEQGRLSLETPAVEAAPELARIDGLNDRRITVGRLLTHTSGIDGDLIFEAGRDKDILRRFLSRVERVGILFEPGAHFSYANVGYALLGRIVELTAGVPFEEALRALLRDDYGLAEFAILPEEKLMFRLALAAMTDPATGRMTIDAPGAYSNIASGTVLAMSMPDLTRWAVTQGASQGGRVQRGMRARGVKTPFSHRYDAWGFGLMLFNEAAPMLYGHNGGTAGTSTFMRIAPERGMAWALSATGPKASLLYNEVERALLQSLKIQTPPRIPPSGACAGDLAAYQGRYERDGMIFDIVAGPGGLTLKASGKFAQASLDGRPMKPLSGHVFEVALPELGLAVWVSFHDFGADGKPRLFCALERMARRTGEAGT